MAAGTEHEAFILRLPDELLEPVLISSARFTPPRPLYTRYEDKDEDEDDYGTSQALPLVCRRFHHLVTPHLYADLVIRCNGRHEPGESVRRTKLLHHTFRESPSLWPHCRMLTILADSPWPFSGAPSFNAESLTMNLLYIAVDLVTWLTGTTKLCIKDCLGDHKMSDILSLVRLAAEHMPGLKHLTLHSRWGSSFDLPLVSDTLSDLGLSACLRTLDISGISYAGADSDWKRLRAKAGTASFTELNLDHFTQSLDALKALVMWPARLERFSFRMPCSDYYSGYPALSQYSLATLQPILATQRATLTHIRIQKIFSSGIEDFDMTRFPKLQSLWLSHDLTGTDTSLVANLVAPHLRVFHWDQQLEDQQCCETLGSFGQREEDWLQAFAAAAVERKSTLRQIRIYYRPDPYLYSYNGEDEDPLLYPWDRMDKIARDIQPHGIHLSYNKPNITREEFNKHLEDRYSY